jgi:MATE family multidrug resistance protein
VLDYGLIFGRLGLPEMGVVGAGLATAIGQWIYALYMIAAFRHRAVHDHYATQPVAPSVDQMRRLLRTGAPIGGQWVLGMLSFAVFSTLIARMGDVSAAASQAAVVLLSLSFMQAIGISIASSTLVGRYIGADDLPAARRSFWSSEKLAGVLGLGIAVAFIAFPELLMRAFSDEPEVIRLGVPLVRVGALFQFFDAFGIVAGGSLRGAGDTRWPFLVQTVFAWGMFVPLAWLLGVYMDGGVFGAWLGGSIYVAVLAIIFVRRFQRGRWQEIII